MTSERRRQYGTGSVHQRSDGRWAGTIEAGYTARGTRRRVTVYGRTEKDARAKVDAARRKIAREGLPTEGALASTTVARWAEQWLEQTQTALRPASWSANRSAVQTWIVPLIGTTRLDRLTPQHVRRVTAAITTAGRSSSTARRTQSVLETMLRAALLEGHDVPRRLLDVTAPAAAVTDRDAIPVPEAVRILEAAARREDASRWIMALLEGQRPAESLGLTWPCVDLDAETIDVSWQLKALPYKIPRDRSSGFRVPHGYEARRLVDAYHLVRPKSKAGWRVLPMVSWLATSLRAWQTVAPVSPYGLVWPRPDGRPRRDRVDRDEWRALQDEAGVRHPSGRYYDLYETRHTAATLLVETGVHSSIIEAILGHSRLVQSYVHAQPAAMRAALAQVAGRLGIEG